MASDFAIRSVLWPKLRTFLPKFPDIKMELLRDNGLTDIVTQRFDASVRMGEQLARDMISVRIGPDVAIFYRHDGQSIPSRGIIVMGKIDSGVEALNVPRSVRVTIEVVENRR